MPGHYLEHILMKCMDTVQESDLAHYFGDLSHIEKESEIKAPIRLEPIVGSTFIKVRQSQ